MLASGGQQREIHRQLDRQVGLRNVAHRLRVRQSGLLRPKLLAQLLVLRVHLLLLLVLLLLHRLLLLLHSRGRSRDRSRGAPVVVEMCWAAAEAIVGEIGRALYVNLQLLAGLFKPHLSVVGAVELVEVRPHLPPLGRGRHRQPSNHLLDLCVEFGGGLPRLDGLLPPHHQPSLLATSGPLRQRARPPLLVQNRLDLRRSVPEVVGAVQFAFELVNLTLGRQRDAFLMQSLGPPAELRLRDDLIGHHIHAERSLGRAYLQQQELVRLLSTCRRELIRGKCAVLVLPGDDTNRLRHTVDRSCRS
mmetsp:Transcript_31972/g.53748  ORF Transcript_31972/g.53748 Transcript_31972/m.53748 type:complete len:303 (-) Transcript_31972:231-1139(-)